MTTLQLHRFLMIIVIALLKLLSVQFAEAVPVPHMPAWNPDGAVLRTIEHGWINGGIYVAGGHGMEYTTSYTENFTVPNGTVKWARLYVSAKDTPWLNVTLNGHALGNYTDLASNPKVYANYRTDDRGMYWAYYDNAAEYIINGSNTATAYLGSRIGLNTKSWGIMLLAVYEGGDRPGFMEYWINEGNPLLHGDHPPFAAHRNSTNTSFADVTDVNNVTIATLWTVYIWGSEESEPQPHDTLWFNADLLAEDASDGAGTDDHTSWRGACFDLEQWDVTRSLDQDNVVLYDRGEDSILCPVGAILIVQRNREQAASRAHQIIPSRELRDAIPGSYRNIPDQEWQSEAQELTSVNPGNLNISAQAGGSGTESLFVVNTGTEVVTCSVYVDEDYADWFDIVPETFNLSSSENTEVIFNLKPPLSAHGKYDPTAYIAASSSDFCAGSKVRVPVQAAVSNSGITMCIVLVFFIIGAGGVLLLHKQ